eukprot:4383662-Amphidinium_carterae.1
MELTHPHYPEDVAQCSTKPDTTTSRLVKVAQPEQPQIVRGVFLDTDNLDMTCAWPSCMNAVGVEAKLACNQSLIFIEPWTG